LPPNIFPLIEKTFPIPERFRAALPSDIARLSRLLTNKRGERSLSYLGRPAFLSAYLYYFMPWNILRLCGLLGRLPAGIELKPGDTVTDLGSGPLTFASALWIARPDLRNIPLEINCVDRSSQALEAGKKFFEALCSAEGTAGTPWKINLVKEDIDIRKADNKKNKKPALVCAVNLFNEIYEKIPHTHTEKLRNAAEAAARLTHNRAAENAPILTVEPGVPQSGRFISFLRGAFLELGRPPLSPCTHEGDCPCAGSKAKRWCHFAFDAADAPKELRRLSTAAKLPKERLTLSYLLTGTAAQENNASQVRVLSDPFPLPGGRFARYGCCEKGLVLITGDKKRIENTASLDTVTAKTLSGERDKKSGAYIMEL
jgi:ribosomal protein RSM22 (predicted rRNA methylase)